MIERDLVYLVGSDPAPPLAPPAVVAGEGVIVSESKSLDHLVCCDGAYPFLRLIPGYFYFIEIEWFDGTCSNTGRFGELEVQWTAGELPASYHGMIAWRTVIDGEPGDLAYTPALYHRAAETFCGRVEVVNLADGSVAASPDVCFGADVSDPLGAYTVEPSLAACEGVPYTCEVVEDAWDPEQCVTWPDGEELPDEPLEEPAPAEETSPTSACAIERHGGHGGLALLALLGLLRRRRGPDRGR
ncbi:MAG: hypothetical protein R3B09_00320 [Nannocystaceae bacterium]